MNCGSCFSEFGLSFNVIIILSLASLVKHLMLKLLKTFNNKQGQVTSSRSHRQLQVGGYCNVNLNSSAGYLLSGVDLEVYFMAALKFYVTKSHINEVYLDCCAFIVEQSGQNANKN